MVYFGGFIFLMRSENLLRTRNCLLNLYQNSSRSALKQLKATIFPPKPKKPLSSFLLYVRQAKLKFHKETPNMAYSEVLKRASMEWAELDHTEKENFIKEYNKNHEIYMNELKEYNDSITDEQRKLWEEKKEKFIQNNNELSKRGKYKILGKPKKPQNPFLCYVASKRNDKNPNTTYREWVKFLSTSWNELSDAEKKSYITEAAQLKTQYEEDLEKWEMEMIQSGHSDVVRYKILKKYKNTTKENEK